MAPGPGAGERHFTLSDCRGGAFAGGRAAVPCVWWPDDQAPALALQEGDAIKCAAALPWRAGSNFGLTLPVGRKQRVTGRPRADKFLVDMVRANVRGKSGGDTATDGGKDIR